MEIMKSCCCCYWKQRQNPIFDYDEFDDMEFEDLVESAVVEPQGHTIWTSIASLFRFKPISNQVISSGYQSLNQFPERNDNDILYGQEELQDAKLLTREQVSLINSNTQNMELQNHNSNTSVSESLEMEMD
jgi:hypothetical protein